MADEVSRLRAIYEGDSSSFDRALNNVQGGIGKTVSALAGLAGGIAGAFAITDSIQNALKFDSAMANIRSVTGDTAEATAALAETLKQTAMSSAIPGGLEAISASYYDIVGGVSDAAARQDIFNAAIATAEAGQASLQGVTSGLVSAMNAYSSTNLTAAYASDILTKTVGMGVGTMDQFVAAMGPISGVMASAGVDFQDMGAAMAFMTTKGTSASQAATRMQAATVSLINPNKEMIELFKKAGITSGTAAIEQYGLAGTLDKLKEAAGGSTEGMTKALGSVEALGAAVALTDEGFKGFSDTFLESAEGATAAARALQLESVSAQFEVFKNTLSGIGLSIGQAFLPALNTLLGGFNAFAQDVQKMGLGGAIEKWWNAGIGWLQTNGKKLLGDAMSTAVAFTDDISAWFKANAPDIAAGVLAWLQGGIDKASQTARNILGSIGTIALQVGANVVDWVKTNAPDIAAGIVGWIQGGINKASETVRNILGSIGAIALKLGSDVVSWVTTNAPDIGAGVLAWFQGGIAKASETVKTAFEGAMVIALKLGDDVTAWVETNAPKIGDAISAWFSNGLATLITEGPAALQDALTKGLNSFTNFAETFKKNAPDLGKAAGEWVREGLKNLGTIISEAIAGIFGGGGGQEQGAAMGEGIAQGMKGSMQGGDIAADMLGGLKDTSAIAGILKGIENLFFGTFGPNGVIAGFFEGLFGMKDGTIKKTFDQFFGKDGVVSKALNDGKKFVDGFITKLSDIGTAISAAFSAAFDIITAPFREALKWIGNAIVEMANSMPDAFSAVRGQMLSLGQALVNFGTSQGERMGPFPQHAMGGRMNPNETAIVGERGPELFTAGSSGGVITANSQIGGSGGSLNLHGVNVYGVENAEQFLDKLIEEAGKRGLQLVF